MQVGLPLGRGGEDAFGKREGAWVELEDDAGESTRYRIVGPDEFDQAPGYISMDAPLARALLGKPLDAEISVPLPGGAAVYTIVAIDYPS